MNVCACEYCETIDPDIYAEGFCQECYEDELCRTGNV